MANGKIRLIALLLGFGFSATISAAPYQFLVSADISKNKFSDSPGDKRETTSTNVFLSYYLQPVPDQNGPLSEQAFLSKISRVSASYGQRDPKDGDKTTRLGFNTRYITPSDLIVDINYNKTSKRVNNNTSTRLGLGKYLDDRSTVVLSLRSFKTDDGFDDSQNVSVYFRRLTDRPAPNTYLSYFLGLGYSEFESDDSSNQIDAGSSYYFSKILSVGASVYYVARKSETTTYGAQASYYFTERLLARLRYFNTRNSDNPDYKSDTTRLELYARF